MVRPRRACHEALDVGSDDFGILAGKLCNLQSPRAQPSQESDSYGDADAASRPVCVVLRPGGWQRITPMALYGRSPLRFVSGSRDGRLRRAPKVEARRRSKPVCDLCHCAANGGASGPSWRRKQESTAPNSLQIEPLGETLGGPEGCHYSDLALQRSSAIVGKMPRVAHRFLYLAVLAPSPPHRIGNADTSLRISPFSSRRPPSTAAALRGPYIEKQMQLEFRHMQATSRQTRSRASRSSPRSITEASALLTSSVQNSRGFRQVAGWPASPCRRDRRSRPELRPSTDPRPRV
jgi:hypothetical protein